MLLGGSEFKPHELDANATTKTQKIFKPKIAMRPKEALQNVLNR